MKGIEGNLDKKYVMILVLTLLKKGNKKIPENLMKISTPWTHTTTHQTNIDSIEGLLALSAYHGHLGKIPMHMKNRYTGRDVLVSGKTGIGILKDYVSAVQAAIVFGYEKMGHPGTEFHGGAGIGRALASAGKAAGRAGNNEAMEGAAAAAALPTSPFAAGATALAWLFIHVPIQAVKYVYGLIPGCIAPHNIYNEYKEAAISGTMNGVPCNQSR